MTFTFIPFFTDPTRIGQLYNRELIRMTEWQEDINGTAHWQIRFLMTEDQEYYLMKEKTESWILLLRKVGIIGMA